MHAASRSSGSYPCIKMQCTQLHTEPSREPPGRAPARAVCVARCVCVSVWVSLATLTRYADGSMQIQKRGTVYSVCMQTRNGASNGSGSGLTGCLSRAHRACAPKPTRMAVGLTRDCRETLRRDVQGSSESSTRRSANSKRHVGAPNRHTKQVKRLVDHRCSGVTVRKVARYQKPSRTPHTRVTGSRPTCLSVALQLSGAPPPAGSQPGQPAGASAPRRVPSPEIFAHPAVFTYQRVEADG